MEYFYSGGGNNRPYFMYRFKVKKCTTDMYQWAEAYPEKGSFNRFHVEWASVYSKMDRPLDYDVIQFEWSEAAKVFRIAFAGEYEEITMKEYICQT
jgi:hypothetical protein